MKIIVGLGNPGARYAAHRHNVGFQVVELLARRHGLTFDSVQHKAQIATGRVGAHKLLLAKPQSFMNESGPPVQALLQFYKVPPEALIVVVDDLDLDFGRIRLRPGGGSGGQNGMKSIIRHLGSEEFARLRVGLGRPPGRMEPAAFVLQNFSAEEEETMGVVREQAADALECWLDKGIAEAMNRYN